MRLQKCPRLGTRIRRHHLFLPAVRVFALWAGSIYAASSIVNFQVNQLLTASCHLRQEKRRTLLGGAYLCFPFISKWGISY